MESWIGKRITLFYKDGEKADGEAHVSRKTGILLGISAEYVTLRVENPNGTLKTTAFPKTNIIRAEREEVSA